MGAPDKHQKLQLINGEGDNQLYPLASAGVLNGFLLLRPRRTIALRLGAVQLQPAAREYGCMSPGWSPRQCRVLRRAV
jgi:hypothetical protein